jgi:hypothetical protein
MAWGTTNAIYAILLAALVIFLTGIPLAITAARYNIRPRPDHPQRRLRLFWLGDHQHYLRRLHLYLLRP